MCKQKTYCVCVCVCVRACMQENVPDPIRKTQSPCAGSDIATYLKIVHLCKQMHYRHSIVVRPKMVTTLRMSIIIVCGSHM